MTRLQLFLPCAAGVEDFLADEVHHLTGLAGDDLLVGRGGVVARAPWREAMRLNLHSRLAQRVLVQLSHTPYRAEADLYEAAAAVPWEAWFTPRQRFKVEITAQHSPLKSLNFAALKIKDAVADRFRAHAGTRPDVDTQRPDVRVFAHLTGEWLTLYIDTSGEPLFKRGWREDKGDAPLKETLAAAMLAASGWSSPRLQAPPSLSGHSGRGAQEWAAGAAAQGVSQSGAASNLKTNHPADGAKNGATNGTANSSTTPGAANGAAKTSADGARQGPATEGAAPPGRGVAHGQPLYDPCCGSGTIVIEAAQIACGIAPGLLRRFAFERLLRHDASDWNAIKNEASAMQHAPTAPIFGSDVAHRMVDFAQRNAQRAGVAHALHLRGGDALQRQPPTATPGLLLLNPPYGERIAAAGVAGTPSGPRRGAATHADARTPAAASRREPPPNRGGREAFQTGPLTLTRPAPGSPDNPGQPSHAAPTAAPGADPQRDDGSREFFQRLAAHWKTHYGGWTAWMLTPDLKLPSKMRLKESRRVPLWNGPIECRLFRFDLTAAVRPPRPATPELSTPPQDANGSGAK